MRKQRVNKLLAWGLCAAMTAGLLTGCGSKPADSGQASSAAPAQGELQETGQEPAESGSVASGEGVTLNFAASQNWIQDVDRDLAKAFEEETGIVINFQLSPDDQYQTIIKSKLNTGEGPDIFMSYSGTKLKDYNPEKNMVDLSGEAWVANQEEWAVQTSSYNGKLYAQNIAGVDDTNGILYQPAMFEELGIKVPTSYAGFTEACEKLKAAGVTPVYEFVKDLWHTHYWMEGASALALANDPKLYDKLNTNEIGFADVPEFVTALEQLQEMEKAGYFGENHMSNIYDNSYEAMTNGTYGMIIIHGSYPNEIKTQFKEDLDTELYSMFPSPLVDNQYVTLTAGGTTKCINAASSHIEEAKLFFDFLARPENVKKLYEEKPLYMQSAVKDITAAPTKAFTDLMAICGDKKAAGAEASVLFYDGGKISELCQEMFTGSLTPSQVLEEFDASRRALAKDAGVEGF